jgi:hypothetical protein
MEVSNDSAQADGPPQREAQTNDIRVNRYGETRYWGVWVDGELLVVTVYKKGAMAVRDRLLGVVTDA